MHIRFKCTLYIFAFLCLIANHTQSQNNSLANYRFQLLNQTITSRLNLNIASTKKAKADSISKIFNPSTHSPKLAIMLSAIVPGAGQIYNKKYWKTPVIWLGLGVSGYFIRSNHILYKDYKDALLQRTDTSIKVPDKYLDLYSTDQLIALQDQYHQSRDLFIIVTSLVYVLNIVDALVDAHLFTFDVSDDLSIDWQPYYKYNNKNSNTAGLSLQLKF